MSLPGSLIPWINLLFTDDAGQGTPLALGTLTFYVTGEATLKDVYAQADLDPGSVLPNPYTLSADGTPADDIFIGPGGYDIEIRDSLGNLIRRSEGIEDVGQTFLSQLGLELSAGARGVTDGYQVVETDLTITVDSSGGASPCNIDLQAVSTRQQDNTIVNTGTEPLALNPNGTDTINGSASPYTVDAASGQEWPAVTLRPDPPSNYIVVAKTF